MAQIEVYHLQDIWPDSLDYPDGVPDEIWMPEIGNRGYTVVSGDMAITTKPAQVIALKKAKIVFYVISGGFVNLKPPEQSRWLFKYWHKIEEHAEKHGARGHAYEIRSEGTIIERNLREVRHAGSNEQ